MIHIMRYLSFLLFTCFLSIISLGQSTNDEIRDTFEEYFQTMVDEDYGSTMEYIYPKLFEHFPKDQLQAVFEQMAADTSMRVGFEQPGIQRISDKMEMEGISYVMVNYSYKMSITFLDAEDDTEGEELNSEEITVNVFRQMYGEDSVSYNSEKHYVLIGVAKNLYAINNPDYKGWKFLEKAENMMPLLEQMIPAKVIKKLK